MTDCFGYFFGNAWGSVNKTRSTWCTTLQIAPITPVTSAVRLGIAEARHRRANRGAMSDSLNLVCHLADCSDCYRDFAVVFGG